MKRKGLLLMLLGGAIAVAVGVFLVWNKPHETVDNKKGVQVTAEALSTAFGQDEAKANATYLNQVIEVSGKIAELSKNQDGKDVLLLESSDPLSGVQCTMRESNGTYNVGSAVRVKGFCNGYTTVVLLSDCITVN